MGKLFVMVLLLVGCGEPSSPEKTSPEDRCAASEFADQRNAQKLDGEFCHKCNTCPAPASNPLAFPERGFWAPDAMGEVVMVSSDTYYVLDGSSESVTYRCDEPIIWADHYCQ